MPKFMGMNTVEKAARAGPTFKDPADIPCPEPAKRAIPPGP
jgi:hypothetical protein